MSGATKTWVSNEGVAEYHVEEMEGPIALRAVDSSFAQTYSRSLVCRTLAAGGQFQWLSYLCQAFLSRDSQWS